MSCENAIIGTLSGKPGGAIGWELAMSPPRSRRMFLRGSKHIVQTKYWSYSERRATCFASRAPYMGRLARTHVFVLSLTRASSEYMGKGKCAPFSCSEPRRTKKKEQEKDMDDVYIVECTQQSANMVHYKLNTLSGGTISGHLLNWNRNSVAVQFGPRVNHYEIRGRNLAKC